MKAIVGKKLGMTRIFNDDGSMVPVTVVEAGPCIVLQRKTVQKDGYSAIQVGFGAKKENKSNKSELGHVKKAGINNASKYVVEFTVPEDLNVNAGSVIKPTIFDKGEKVSVTGTSIGKGFQGTVKRWGFAIGPLSHGSKTHRGPGTLGPGTGKSNVFKGKKLPGHMGNKKVTIAGLEIVDILEDKNVLLISGAIPGPKNGYVIIKTKGAEFSIDKIEVSELAKESVVTADQEVSQEVSTEDKASE